MACGRLLDLIQPEVDPFDPQLTHKILLYRGITKHEVDRMACCGDIADFSLRIYVIYFRRKFWRRIPNRTPHFLFHIHLYYSKWLYLA